MPGLAKAGFYPLFYGVIYPILRNLSFSFPLEKFVRSFESLGDRIALVIRLIFYFINTTKMKRTIIVAIIAVLAVFTVTSCTASRGGCKATQNFVGYGSR